MTGSTILQICQPSFRSHDSYNEFYFDFYVFKLKIILYRGYLYQHQSKLLVLQFYKFVNPRLGIIIHIMNFILFSMYSK